MTRNHEINKVVGLVTMAVKVYPNNSPLIYRFSSTVSKQVISKVISLQSLSIIEYLFNLYQPNKVDTSGIRIKYCKAPCSCINVGGGNISHYQYFL